jgi:hypothetical protein
LGTSTAVKFEVATGGDPVTAFNAAVFEHVAGTGTLYQAGVAHDDGCPCTTPGRDLSACTCEIIEITLTKTREQEGTG